jgi:hypothetical protein
VTFNLDSLKQELLDYIALEGFAVFRGRSGLIENLPTVDWDTDNHPDYHEFLSVAKHAGVRVVVFTHRELELQEIEEALEQLEDCEFGRDEQRSIERSLSDLRGFAGSTCSIEMAFDYEGRMYVYELVTEWFQTFLDLSELLLAASSEDDDEDDADGSFGGYYSKN